MKNNIISTLVLFLYVSISLAQSSLDAYKYILVPRKFDFLKDENKYDLNSLTKFLFEKQDFKTLYEDENYPSDLLKNPCLALTVDVKDDSSMFTTKLEVELSNCYKKVVFTSEQGKSKEKEYKKSYNEALRNSFVSIEELEYSFDENLVVNKQVVKEVPPSAIATPTLVTPVVAVVPATPVVKEVVKPVPTNVNEKQSVAKSYKNENISFILIDQNNSLVAYVKSSNNAVYQMGEKIGTLKKTSRPNTYRITWKAIDGKVHETTGYFDDKGNLKIDIEIDGNIQVVTFTKEN